jgi:hypothetical protein
VANLAGTSFALQYNDDGSFYGLLKVRVTGVLIDSDHMDLTVSGGVFDLNGNPKFHDGRRSRPDQSDLSRQLRSVDEN